MEVNEGYSASEMQEQIKAVLEKEKIVQLQQFFAGDIAVLSSAIDALPIEKVCDPLIYKHSYVVPDEKVKSLLQPVLSFVEQITGIRLDKIQIVIAEQGDYFIITDEQKAEDGYDAILDITSTLR